MANIELTGAIKALLDEYQKALNELIEVIRPLNYSQLAMVVDHTTNDPDCKSIQTILSHVVRSGYGYTIYIENHLGASKPLLKRVYFDTTDQYIQELNRMFAYCENFFKNNPDLAIEQKANNQKIKVNWGQRYDIEQLLEHAIVHILRHRRQIEHFIVKQKLT